MTLPNSPADITWADDLVEDTTCPVCGHRGASQTVLHARPEEAEESMSLQRCQACSSLFFPNAAVLHYDATETDPETFLQHYLEAGAGLWEMYWPIGRIGTPERKTLLDVGCGFGWSVDIWNSLAERESVGVELADWGRRGRESLGVTIHSGSTSEVAAIHGQLFDVVYACEVIEHVADPYAFVEELKQYLAPSGVLVLTTPAAEFIAAENSDHEIIAQLCPGAHLFLFTRDSLTQLLERCGFEHIQVFRQRERLFAYASHQKIGESLANSELRDQLIAYLRERMDAFSKDSTLYAGAAYRLIKEQILTGAWEHAAQNMIDLDESLSARFGLDFNNPVEIVWKIKEIDSWTTWGQHLPYFMGSYAFFKAEIALHCGRDFHRAMEWSTVAIILGKHALRIQSAYFTEAIQLMWSAYARLIQLTIHQKQIEDALALASELCDPGQISARPQLEPISNVLVELAMAIFAQRNPNHGNALIDLCHATEQHPEHDPLARELIDIIGALTEAAMRFEQEDRLQGLAECTARTDRLLASPGLASRTSLKGAIQTLRKVLPKPKQPSPTAPGVLGNPMGSTRWSGWRH